MEGNILQLIATQGAFAILFCYLLFYVLKENSRREENYQEIIKNFSDSLPKIENNIEEIQHTLKIRNDQ